jgi:hypothetical protein
MKINWQDDKLLTSHSYKCGHCHKDLASERGYWGTDDHNRHHYIYICHFCHKPSYIDPSEKQFPGETFGDEVANVTDSNVLEMYNQARNCMSVNAYTAAVLCCRKLLMHIAVSKGAKEGLYFAEYAQFLCDNHFVPPDAREWVVHIKDKGNEANHEIKIMSKDEAELLISFCGMLLKNIFEFPSRVPKKVATASVK